MLLYISVFGPGLLLLRERKAAKAAESDEELSNDEDVDNVSRPKRATRGTTVAFLNVYERYERPLFDEKEEKSAGASGEKKRQQLKRPADTQEWRKID
jgi:hypothetical protein